MKLLFFSDFGEVFDISPRNTMLADWPKHVSKLLLKRR